MTAPRDQAQAPLLTRAELRLALAAGLSTGLATLTGIPYGYYAPLSVLAAMGVSYGSSLELGRQRLLGTLLGAVVLVIAHAGMRDVPLPLGLAIALGAQRLLGGLLRLEVGYKVGGIVIVMGWLTHSEQFGEWIPLRLFWSTVGIVISLLSMQLLWPASAVRNGWRQWSQLLDQLARAVGQVAVSFAGHPRHAPAAVGALRARLVALRATLPAVRRELGARAPDHPVLTLIACLDESCSRLIGVLGGLQRAQPHTPSPALQLVRDGEAALLDVVAQRLTLWSAALDRFAAQSSHGLPEPPAEPLVLPRLWCEAERWLDDPLLNRLSLERLQRVAVRLQLCRQLIDALQRTEQAWQHTHLRNSR